MKLSVIIPAFNAAATLGEQLEAVAEQAWEGGWEVIVVDNGSTDATAEVARRYASRFPAFRLVKAEGRSGPAHSRNVGASAATGEALVFCDADDVVGVGWLEAMGRALAEHEFVAARYDAERLNSPLVARARRAHQADGLNPYTYPPFLPHAGGSSLGVRKRLHDEVGGFDESLPALEDTDYCWRAQLAGHELVSVADALVHVRYREDTRASWRQNLRFGEYNVLLYRRYRGRGMPRLQPWLGPAKWLRLALSLPQMLGREGRARWLASFGWRVGRLVGCWKYRVWAP